MGHLRLPINLAVSLFFDHRHLDFAFVLRKTLQWALAGLILGWVIWRFEFEDEEN